MRTSIIIPTLNEEACIARTLDALHALEGDKEIIVADGGSTDDTVVIAKSRGATVIQAETGRGQQMRAGAACGSGDTLWFVHADTMAPQSALREIGKALSDPSVVAGNFNLAFDGSSRAARQMTAIYPFLRLLGLSYGDSAIFVRRGAYDNAGGFRPLALFEDLDLLKRVRRLGRFIHLEARVVTSSRRFDQHNFALMWARWTALQALYWCGVSPAVLARYYSHARNSSPHASSG